MSPPDPKPSYEELALRCEELTRRLEELTTTFDTLTEGVALNEGIFDDEGVMVDYRILEVNRAFHELADFVGDEVLGKTATELYRIESKLIREFWKIHKDAREVIVTEMTSPVSGRHFTISTSPLLGSRFVTTFQDVTERKRQEVESEMLQQHLYQAQKLETVGRLAGGVAHDFNNILGAIMGYAELVRNRLQPDHPSQVDVGEIIQASERAAALTRKLLGFARKQPIAPVPLDPNEVVGGMMRMLRRLVREEVALSWVPGRDVWQVRVDPYQLDQIMTNLVVNAEDAIAQTGTITIETGNEHFDEVGPGVPSEAKVGDFVHIVVRDDGSGIAEDVLDHIIEPFFTTKEHGKGTGLGLATVYGIVKQNGGFLDVRSEVGKGSEFRIYLPRCEGDDLEVIDSEQEPVGGGTETVLFVEDDPSLLRLGARLLEQLGYTVIASSTPGRALVLAQRHPGTIHALVTDVLLPEMNGTQLAARVTELRPDIACLFISGHSADVLEGKCLVEGSILVHKPFTLGELAQQLRLALDRR